ncbi:Rieske (2Fe-2S) protein [Streptacidiphilus sp. PB12-B1b]|uniref:Rieske (2Fe-2S) protein n=1 Tax=Streptacidiphilus sp. PB12-B1b TaxID=2705012 RepID=UPI0015F80062|nr:Rieske (2Fe-2S) protein [Streptacidiphilus sp. PB12-B1b]QMU78614.1 Rieske (2Fe-2S) protein [Streptacidiphilus sp. PB12-B1b]
MAQPSTPLTDPAPVTDPAAPDGQAAAPADCGACCSGATRRGLLRGAAAVGVAGAAGLALAACSSGSSGSTASGPTTLGPSTDVPVGGGKLYRSDKVVVTQPTAGVFKAFSAICTHAGCTVDGVTHGVIQCPCHGSQFDISTGDVVTGPATAPLPGRTLAVTGGKIVVTL